MQRMVGLSATGALSLQNHQAHWLALERIGNLRMKYIAVMGYGVVGSGVVEVFYKNRESIQRKAGTEMDIKYVLDLRDFPDSPYADKMIKDFRTIVEDDEVAIVVEVMGGVEPAFSYSKECLMKGKSVVTSNKELVATKGAELLKLARENHVNYLFEASVGGGIPIIRPLHQCLGANEIDEIEGILNGTTNFILTKMIREKMDFAEALGIAQELGYAEKDPTADVEGLDAGRKICILASIACGKHVYPEYVHTEGITKLTLEDVDYAKDFGGVIKLIGKADMHQDGTVSALVAPRIVPNESQLSTVDDVFNGILVRGDATGEVVFYGKGAGKLPTASAVVADVIDCAKATETIKSLYWADSAENFVRDYKDETVCMYVRCKLQYRAQTQTIKELFQDCTVLNRKGQADKESAFVTAPMKECEITSRLDQMGSEGIEILGKIRVL